ncbi:MAG: phosphoribosylpyrophosphate synthetase [Ignavibacteria bacterium]|jgi:hypothetical protein|nr:phosphoribosylpyrophosphate synthetase [Ignavibacteria bacterium]
MKNYRPTLTETLNILKSEGYTEDFNLSNDCIDCNSNKLKIFPSEFKVDKYFRFEGPSDPADNAILYAISSDKYKMKGVAVNGYGVYADSLTNEMLNKLTTR